MEKTTFTQLFAPFDRAGVTTRYQSPRQAARARLQALPFPSTRTEDWRFTNVAPILETPFEQPIEILSLSLPTAKPLVTHPRTLLLLGNDAQATVIERYLSVGEGVYFSNAVTEIVLAEHAVVDHVKVQQESLQGYHVANTQI